MITTFWKYRHKHLPMGLKCAPDAGCCTTNYGRSPLWTGHVEVYLINISLFGKSWEELLLSKDKVLSHLEANCFTVYPFKCKWAVQETNWLGYWLMPTSLKHWKKHISAILEQEPFCNLMEMCGFLGAVNAYHLMWPKWAHWLKPLSDKSGKKPFIGIQQWIKPSNTWKQSCQRMSLWHTLTITYLFTYTLKAPTIKLVFSISSSITPLHIGQKNWPTPNKIIIPWTRNLFHCYGSQNVLFHASWCRTFHLYQS